MIFMSFFGASQYIHLINSDRPLFSWFSSKYHLTMPAFPFCIIKYNTNSNLYFRIKFNYTNSVQRTRLTQIYLFCFTHPCMSSKPKDGLFCNYHLKVLKFSLSTFLGVFEVQFTKTTIFSGADRIVFFIGLYKGNVSRLGLG